MIEPIEIMAPVGCWESLAAAIQAGATSVYFGIEHLNMRARVPNADGDTIALCQMGKSGAYLGKIVLHLGDKTAK